MRQKMGFVIFLSSYNVPNILRLKLSKVLKRQKFEDRGGGYPIHNTYTP